MGIKKFIAASAVAVLAASAFAIAPASAVSGGNTQGCTPGFWKNHTPWSSYVQGGYEPGTTVAYMLRERTSPGVFGPDYTFPSALSSFQSVTMGTALNGGGGSGVTGAATILLRAGTAAWLNADAEIAFPYRRWTTGFNGEAPLQKLITDALNSGSRDTMLALATKLDNANNLGCPLS